MNDIRIIETPQKAILGEGPRWVARDNALYWVDIMAPALHRLDLASDRVRSWAFYEPIGWIIEREGRDDFLVGLKSGFARLSLDPFLLEPIGDPEPDRPHNRLNDAKTDAAGRIWAGSKDDRDEEASGALYRLEGDLRWARVDDGYQVTNGPTFSADGKVLYHTDSGRRTVYAFDLDEDGTITGKREWLRFEEEWGYPDGMTTDAEGGIWIAHWGGARLSRFFPDARLDRSITFPAANITSCAFVGPKLDRLFVTSAALSDEQNPEAGSLFEVDVDVCGLPARGFAG
jgi:sugar lactone lactonase YvrE